MVRTRRESHEHFPEFDAAPAIGLGTYRPASAEPSILSHALKSGVVHLDTAPNYANGKAQVQIGQVLRSMAVAPAPPMPLRISSKVGFVPAGTDSAYLSPEERSRRYSLSPGYIRCQLWATLEQLGTDKLDCLLLHNPEVLLKSGDAASLQETIRSAFIECERLASDGLISSYGIASWGELLSALPPSKLMSMANEIAGTLSCFRRLQVPISLVKSTSIESLITGTGLLCEAIEQGVSIHASSPLHGGALARIVTRGLADFVGSGLTPAQASLQFVRSVPGVSVVLVGVSSPSQLTELLAVRYAPLLDVDNVRDLARLINNGKS